MINKTIHRKRKIEQHKYLRKTTSSEFRFSGMSSSSCSPGDTNWWCFSFQHRK